MYGHINSTAHEGKVTMAKIRWSTRSTNRWKDEDEEKVACTGAGRGRRCGCSSPTAVFAVMCSQSQQPMATLARMKLVSEIDGEWVMELELPTRLLGSGRCIMLT